MKVLENRKREKMTSEQKFFEAFGIEPTMLCNCSYKNLQEYRYEYGDDVLQEYRYEYGDDVCEHIDDFEFSCKDCENYYPPITPEIVLGLEAIVMLVNDDYNFSVEQFSDESRFLFCDKKVILENENNLKDCILSSCIQLKYEIKDQVRALFND